MKVLFVSGTHCNDKSSYNHRLLMLQRGLQRCGAQADFLYLRDRIRSRMGWRLDQAPAVLFPVQFSHLLPLVRAYDVIHLGAAFVAFPFCLFRGHFQASLMHDMHGDLKNEALLEWQSNRTSLRNTLRYLQALLLEQVAIHRADYHLVVSQPLLKRLLAHNIAGTRALVLRNGVDISTFKPNGIPRNDIFTVCYAGDFQIWQGVDMLIEAGRMLRDLDIKWKFIGFRQTQDHRRWREKITASLRTGVELVDRVSQRDLVHLLHATDLLVLPRPYHPATAVAMPTKFAEYIALGKPVVVTDIDETAQFVRQHRCGLVCQPTASGLAEAIVQAREMDKAQLQAMGHRGRQLAESTFAWDVICQRYYDFLCKRVRTTVR